MCSKLQLIAVVVAAAASLAGAPSGTPDLSPCALGPAGVLVAPSVVSANPVGDFVANANVILKWKQLDVGQSTFLAVACCSTIVRKGSLKF